MAKSHKGKALVVCTEGGHDHWINTPAYATDLFDLRRKPRGTSWIAGNAPPVSDHRRGYLTFARRGPVSPLTSPRRCSRAGSGRLTWRSRNGSTRRSPTKRCSTYLLDPRSALRRAGTRDVDDAGVISPRCAAALPTRGCFYFYSRRSALHVSAWTRKSRLQHEREKRRGLRASTHHRC